MDFQKSVKQKESVPALLFNYMPIDILMNVFYNHYKLVISIWRCLKSINQFETHTRGISRGR